MLRTAGHATLGAQYTMVTRDAGPVQAGPVPLGRKAIREEGQLTGTSPRASTAPSQARITRPQS
jgi:hypothetical protein